ncbi:MAG: hypothetical protein ACOYXT_09605 [Bacteroidota bacterium]
MTKKLWPIAFLFALLIVSCSKDEDAVPASKLNHVGEKWNITSVEYNLIDQSLSGQAVKFGTKTNAGTFYLNGDQGSFDIIIDNYRLEDYFSYEENAGDITIISINQNVGTSNFSQYVTVISGDKVSATSITLSGTFSKQSNTGQFIFTGSFELTKE